MGLSNAFNLAIQSMGHSLSTLLPSISQTAAANRTSIKTNSLNPLATRHPGVAVEDFAANLDQGANAQVVSSSSSGQAAENAWRKFSGTVDVSGKGFGEIDKALKPYVDPNFDDFQNYSQQELQDYYGDIGQIMRSSNDLGIPDAVMHQMKDDSRFAQLMQDQGLYYDQAQALWDRTSEITGYLFQEGTDKFENAAHGSAQKLIDAGLGDLLSVTGLNVGDNAEVLAHVMKNNTSVEGLRNFAPVLRAFMQNRDFSVDTGIVQKAALNGQKVKGLNHGNTFLSGQEMTQFTQNLNFKMYSDVVTAMGYNEMDVRAGLIQDSGVTGTTNYDGSVFAAMGVGNLMFKQDYTETTGWDNLVSQSRSRDGDPTKRYQAQVVLLHMNDGWDQKTDSGAFKRTDMASVGLDAVATLYGGGLRNNPMNPNVIIIGYQGAKAGDSIASNADLAKKFQVLHRAGIDVIGVNGMVSGHGDREGDSASVLMKSGRTDLDQTSFDKNDAFALTDTIAANAPMLRHFNVTCDACQAAPLARDITNAMAKAAAARGMNVRSTGSGSLRDGAVLSQNLGESKNGDTRAIVNKDGTVSFYRFRGDHNGGSNNIRHFEAFSMGKEAYSQRMMDIRNGNQEVQYADSNNSTQDQSQSYIPQEQEELSEEAIPPIQEQEIGDLDQMINQDQLIA